MDFKTLHRYLSGECTGQERRKVQMWLKGDTLNQEHFNLLKKIWDTEIESPVNFDSSEGLRRIKEQLSQEKKTMKLIGGLSSSKSKAEVTEIDKENGKEENLGINLFYKIAAVLLIGFVGIGLLYLQLNDRKGIIDKFVQQDLPEVQSFETQRGEINSFAIKEGIQLKMNTSSSISVYSDEEKDQVILDGEAFFDIKSDRDDPKKFIVQSKSVTVNVIGTKFNVRNRAEQQIIEVAVQKGKVRVELFSDHYISDTILLKEGEQLVFNEKESSYLINDQVNIEDLLLWMNGGFVFKNTQLSEVLTSLERRFDVDFIIKETAPLHRPFSARFNSEVLSEILDITSLSLGFEYKKVEEGLYEIYNSSAVDTTSNSTFKE